MFIYVLVKRIMRSYCPIVLDSEGAVRTVPLWSKDGVGAAPGVTAGSSGCWMELAGHPALGAKANAGRSVERFEVIGAGGGEVDERASGRSGSQSTRSQE